MPLAKVADRIKLAVFLKGLRLVRRLVLLIALSVSACAPAGYMYDTGSFVAHPTPALCASRGQVLDSTTLDCVTPPLPPPPSPMQIAQQHASDTIKRQRDACVSIATAQFHRMADGPVASPAIWRAELKQCDDLMISRLTAQQLQIMGGTCSLKLDWMMRYQMMVYDPEQKAMAEDRYVAICETRRALQHDALKNRATADAISPGANHGFVCRRSPPASDSFFYRGNSGLTNYMRDTLGGPKGDTELLNWFKARGWYLDDLVTAPIENLRNRRNQSRDARASLAARIAEYQPAAIVCLLKSICDDVEIAASKAGCKAPLCALPFAGQRHQTQFKEQMKRILPKLPVALA